MIFVDEAILDRVAVTSSIFLDPLPRLPDCRLCVAAAALHARSSHRTKGDNARRTRRYLGRSRSRVASVYICVSSKCTLARRQPAATRRSHQTNFGMPRATWHRPIARVGTGTRSEPHPQRVAEVLLHGSIGCDRCDRRAMLFNRLRIRAVTSDWDTSSSASSPRCVKLLLARGVVMVVEH